MFDALDSLAKPTIDFAGTHLRPTDVLAAGLVAYTGIRWARASSALHKSQNATLQDQVSITQTNALGLIEQEAQDSMNWALGLGAALVVLPRLLK